jgi:cytochrome c
VIESLIDGYLRYLLWAGLCLLIGVVPVRTLADENVQAGKLLFGLKCMSCHSVREGSGNGAGPNLFGITGRHIGSLAGFNYSNAMLSHREETWSSERLDRFIAQPQAAVPGTLMIFPGLSDPEQRKNLIAFLESLGEEKHE